MERDSGREKFALDWDTKRSKGDYSRYHRGPQVVSMHMCMTPLILQDSLSTSKVKF